MTVHEMGTVIAIVVGVCGLATTIYLAGVKIARIELKVDTLWEFSIRRGISEGVQKGIATMNSPVQITEHAKQWMQGIAAELRAFYARLGRRISDMDLTIEIERRYGDRILTEVCIPNNLMQGACLLIAVEVAKELVK